MDDLISREYLVEHIHACMENDRLMKTATKEEILQMVADTPSAQPPRAIKDCRNCRHVNYNDHWGNYFCYCPDNCSDWDKWEPSADVRENVKGEWQITDAYPHNVYCSNCHKKFAQTHWAVWEDGSLPRNYCPNCGADMRGDKT